ncbi:IS3 family transposase [Komagataeibacter europaeus]|uniref:IS3 family transposase n=1 Tax=Komagataeibacter europaeus TaxID=33995 RepID=UPI0038CDC0F5
MSGKGNCSDNAAVETFFRSLKVERLWRQNWPTHRQATAAIFPYINGFYNPCRHHSYLGSICPFAFAARVAQSLPDRHKTVASPILAVTIPTQ